MVLSGAGRSSTARLSGANFASVSFARARAMAALTVALFALLLKLFDIADFLKEAALANLFAEPRAPAAGLLRFRFEGFAAVSFIFARMVFGAALALEAGLLLPARLRAVDEDATLETRFEVGFAVEAGLVFFVFDFVVFFDLLRAAIVNSPRAIALAYAESPCANPLANMASGPLSPKPRFVRGVSRDFRSTINLSFSTKSSKNQRRRCAPGGDNDSAWLRAVETRRV